MSDQDKRPDGGQGGGEGPQTGIVVKARPRTKKPAMYKVLTVSYTHLTLPTNREV